MNLRLIFGAVCALGTWTAAQAGTITVYTALEEDDAKIYLDAFRAKNPAITVNLLRLSAGDLGARILAESSNPRHDVIWGWTATNIVNPKVVNLLEAYTPPGLDKVDGKFKDPGGKWFATTGYFAAFCVNKKIAAEKKLPIPTSWADLAKPVYKGEIVIPNPASAGTGYLQASSILQILGEDAGWKYLKDLDKNVAQYIKSGSRPCKMAATGEFAIGASFAFAAIKNIGEGFPIQMVIPSEGAGYELEVNALMKTSTNKADAKTFLDWLLSPEAARLYGERAEMNSIPGSEQPKAVRDAGMPADVTKVLYKVDFNWSAANKERVIKRWQAEIER